MRNEREYSYHGKTRVISFSPQRLALSSILAITVFLFSFMILNTPPATFPVAAELSIEEGSTLRDIAETLEANGYIRSAFLFNGLVISVFNNPIIQAGRYQFAEAYSTYELIELLENGAAQKPHELITFPEGFTVYDMRAYTKERFVAIDTEKLLQHEGYLFPDTYAVSAHETLDDLILRMRAEYTRKLAPFQEAIEASPFTEAEVIILASILEREANDETSMRRVSGILQNRLNLGFPLQVDAVFEYILGKTSAELTAEDLELDSPYNTYTNTGLPPTPIANPGLMAIRAVLEPTSSDDFFYLTGDDGTFHYAQTFEEHKENKFRYIK